MGHLLSSALKKILLLFIRFYQLYVSNKIDRSCIYKQNCSNYAIDKLSESKDIATAIKAIFNRINGCKITRIICDNSRQWQVINGNNEIIKENELNDCYKKKINHTQTQSYLL
jgi:putative component of membrane protein insertase Oxa1/YidC/SpoIIIJ protein YidD